jgi:hypothetical protein
MRVSDLKKLKELGVRRAVLDERGQVREVEFMEQSPDAEVMAQLQSTISKWDREYEELTPEERRERLQYGHAQ